MNDRQTAVGQAKTKSDGLVESRTMTTAGAIEATSTQLPLAILCRDLRQFRVSASEPVIDDKRITLPESSRNSHVSICRETHAKQIATPEAGGAHVHKRGNNASLGAA
jgi:hypothetical protein